MDNNLYIDLIHFEMHNLRKINFVTNTTESNKKDNESNQHKNESDLIRKYDWKKISFKYYFGRANQKFK